MRDPFHARREPPQEFAIKDADAQCAGVASVDSHGALVRPARLEASNELGAGGRIVYLYISMRCQLMFVFAQSVRTITCAMPSKSVCISSWTHLGVPEPIRDQEHKNCVVHGLN